MKENNFFKRKNLYMYQKAKMPHRLLPLTEQVFEGFASGKMVLQLFLIYRVLLMQCGGRGHHISCTKQVSPTIFFKSFLFFSVLHQWLGLHNHWCSEGSFLNPFLFLTITADMTLEELKQTSEIPIESKYADNFEIRRKGTDFYHLLIQT